MSGVRIYDLAKELNVPNNEILDLLKQMGEPARTASSTLPDALVDCGAAAHQQRNRSRGRRARDSRCSRDNCRLPRTSLFLQTAPPRPTAQLPANGTANGANGPSRSAPAPVPAAPAAPAIPATPVDVPEVITLKDFAQLIGVPAPDIQKKLMGLGVLASLNQRLDSNVTTRLAKSYKVSINVKTAVCACCWQTEPRPPPRRKRPKWRLSPRSRAKSPLGLSPARRS